MSLMEMNKLRNVENFKKFPELINFFETELSEFKISKNQNIHLYVPSAKEIDFKKRICHITPVENQIIKIKEANDTNNSSSEYYNLLKDILNNKKSNGEEKEIILSGKDALDNFVKAVKKISEIDESGSNLKINSIDGNSTSEDHLNREHISEAIVDYMYSSKNHISTIGMFSFWGNGKSSFIRNICKKIEAKNNDSNSKKDTKKIIPIEIDSVLSDDCEKFWVLIYQKLFEQFAEDNEIIETIRFLINPIDKDKTKSKEKLDFYYINLWNKIKLKTKTILKRIIAYINLYALPKIILFISLVISLYILNTKSSENVNYKFILFLLLLYVAIDYIIRINGVINENIDLFDFKYTKKLGFKSNIQNKIEKITKKIAYNENTKILIIIDELDRANSEKIIETLESTHLLLKNEKLIIFFSINPLEIGKALATDKKDEDLKGYKLYCYGREYLEKYMDIYFFLPQVDKCDMLIENLLKNQIEEDNSKKDNSSQGDDEDKSSQKKKSDSSQGDNEDKFSQGDDEYKSNEINYLEKHKNVVIETINNIIENINNSNLNREDKYTCINKITPRKIKQLVALVNLALSIYHKEKESLKEESDESLLIKFLLYSLGLFDYNDISEFLECKNESLHAKFINILEEYKVKDTDLNNSEQFINDYGKKYLSLFAARIDF